MPTGCLFTGLGKERAKSHVIDNLLTLNIQFLWENLKLWPCHTDLAIHVAWSVRQGGV